MLIGLLKPKFVLAHMGLFVAAILLVGCGTNTTSESQVRWYSAEQVEQGLGLYQQNCMTCHGVAGVGTSDWRELRTAPPLNGTAHTWHHSFAVLDQIIVEGGVAFGGSMPAFGGKLNVVQRSAIIAYLQNQWSDEVYEAWDTTNRL